MNYEEIRVCKHCFKEKVYGITLEKFERMVELQENKCAICEEVFTKVPCIDHNHSTGAVRQLLCKECNLVLGLAKEKPETLVKAAAYLKQFGAAC